MRERQRVRSGQARATVIEAVNIDGPGPRTVTRATLVEVPTVGAAASAFGHVGIAAQVTEPRTPTSP